MITSLTISEGSALLTSFSEVPPLPSEVDCNVQPDGSRMVFTLCDTGTKTSFVPVTPTLTDESLIEPTLIVTDCFCGELDPCWPVVPVVLELELPLPLAAPLLGVPFPCWLFPVGVFWPVPCLVECGGLMVMGWETGPGLADEVPVPHPTTVTEANSDRISRRPLDALFTVITPFLGRSPDAAVQTPPTSSLLTITLTALLCVVSFVSSFGADATISSQQRGVPS